MSSEQEIWARLPAFPTALQLERALEGTAHTTTPEAAKITSLYEELLKTITKEAPDVSAFSLQEDFFSYAPNINLVLRTMQFTQKVVNAIIFAAPEFPGDDPRKNDLRAIAEMTVKRVATWENADSDDKKHHRNVALSWALDSAKVFQDLFTEEKILDAVKGEDLPHNFFTYICLGRSLMSFSSLLPYQLPRPYGFERP